MNSNAHFEHVRHKYLIKLISWAAVYVNRVISYAIWWMPSKKTHKYGKRERQTSTAG